MAFLDDFSIEWYMLLTAAGVRKAWWLARVFLLFLLFTEEFEYNKEERYECKGGEMFGSQRRFPGPIFWDYKVKSWMGSQESL